MNLNVELIKISHGHASAYSTCSRSAVASLNFSLQFCQGFALAAERIPKLLNVAVDTVRHCRNTQCHNTGLAASFHGLLCLRQLSLRRPSVF